MLLSGQSQNDKRLMNNNDDYSVIFINADIHFSSHFASYICKAP